MEAEERAVGGSLNVSDEAVVVEATLSIVVLVCLGLNTRILKDGDMITPSRVLLES